MILLLNLYKINEQYMKNLEQQIKELNDNLAKQLPTKVLETFEKSIQDIKAKNIENNSLNIGEKFPDFALFNTNNEIIELKELLKKGKVVVAFFRGNWCPYCNIEMKALQENLKNITTKNTTLLAISPQKIDYNEELKHHQNLDFELLTDKDNILAKKLGILFKLQDYTIQTYNSLNINLSEFNDNKNNNELPVPAVYVIDENHTIIYTFIDSNYMNRLNIEELIAQL